VALVTGSSSGFGLLSAVELSRRGYKVYASMRDVGKANALAGVAAAAGVGVTPLQLDVSDDASVEVGVGAVLAKEARIDVLVNNAGINAAYGFLEQVTPAEFDEVMQTNFYGALRTINAVLPGMRERGRGHIINVSSIYGFTGVPLGSAYAASKWALEGLSESLRFELRTLGVQVVLVEPGYFRTALLTTNMRVAAAAHDQGSPLHAPVWHTLAEFNRSVAPLAGDPSVVARLIADVADNPRPRLRYVVGKDGKLLRLLRSCLPWLVYENLVVARMRRALLARTDPDVGRNVPKLE
jgi:NAD(P)-dependent dehydrogenase (short-subunit alcohol dehydrogenase family)